MLEGLAPDLAPRLMLAIGGVALAFIALIAVLVFLKRRNSPLFIKGGRAREHRLLVLDAAAVDARRRLVLIRRDDTEHLIMIGGPTDIVIETCIDGQWRQKSPDTAIRNVGFEAPVAVETPVHRAAEPTPKPVQRPVPAPEPLVAARAPEKPVMAAPHPARPTAEIQPAEAKAISAMANVLYDEDRDPFNTIRPAAKTAETPHLDEPGMKETPLPTAAALAGGAPADAATAAAANDAALRAMTERLEAVKAQAQRAEAERIETEQAEAARTEAARLEAVQLEAQRAEAARIEAQKAAIARMEAQRAEIARREAERIEAQRQEAQRIEAQRQEALRVETGRLEAQKAEAQRAAELAEAARLEAEKKELESSRVIEPAMMLAAEGEPISAQARDDLASDFEQFLEVELQKDGLIDDGIAPAVVGEIRERPQAVSGPVKLAAVRDAGQVTGATPGVTAEKDMARRLGEISLNKKTDAL